MKKFKNIFFILILIFLSIPAILPFFHEGLFTMHDDTQVVRVAQMAQSLKDGQFPVRIVNDLGYGYTYPIFNFYSPLPYYFGATPVLLGFSPLTGTKIMFIVAIFGSAITMFILGRRLSNNLGGLTSAVLYLYAPYHAVDIYVRGAVGELWAFVALPIIFLGIFYILLFDGTNTKKTYKYITNSIIITTIGFTFLFLSHLITSVLIVFLYIILILLIMTYELIFKKIMIQIFFIKTSILIVPIIFSLSLSAFFIIPAYFEKNIVDIESLVSGANDYRMHFLTLDQLWDSPWGYAGSSIGKADGMSFKVGKLNIIIGLFGLFSLVWQMHKKSAKYKPIIYYIFIILTVFISVFMTNYISQFIWNIIPIFKFIQFPWRFLTIIIFSISTIACFIKINNKLINSIIFIFIILTTLIVQIKYFKPQGYNVLSVEEYENDYYVKWRTSKISDEYLPKNIIIPLNFEEVPKTIFNFTNTVKILEFIDKTQQKQIQYKSDMPTELKINVGFFPGWHIMIDGKDVDYKLNNSLPVITVPAGIHIVTVSFNNTLLRTMANMLSLFSLFILFGTIMKLKKASI